MEGRLLVSVQDLLLHKGASLLWQCMPSIFSSAIIQYPKT